MRTQDIGAAIADGEDLDDLPAIGVKASKATGTGRQPGSTFASVWDASHSYTLVAAGKCGIARGARVETVTNCEGHRLNEWYLAKCAGNDTHSAHLLTFGGIGEVREHARGQHGKVHTLATSTGETLASVRENRVKPMEPKVGHAAAVARWSAKLSK